MATPQNMQQTLPLTLRQYMDQRQSAQPCRHRKPTRHRRPKKKRIGDWEADTIIGKDQKSALLTLVERITRYTIICKLKNLKAEDTAQVAIKALKVHKIRVHTITMDNGKEFYQHTKIAKALKAENYFCRPYHSWEKGLNENTNGLRNLWRNQI